MYNLVTSCCRCQQIYGGRRGPTCRRCGSQPGGCCWTATRGCAAPRDASSAPPSQMPRLVRQVTGFGVQGLGLNSKSRDLCCKDGGARATYRATDGDRLPESLAGMEYVATANRRRTRRPMLARRSNVPYSRPNRCRTMPCGCRMSAMFPGETRNRLADGCVKTRSDAPCRRADAGEQRRPGGAPRAGQLPAAGGRGLRRGHSPPGRPLTLPGFEL